MGQVREGTVVALQRRRMKQKQQFCVLHYIPNFAHWMHPIVTKHLIDFFLPLQVKCHPNLDMFWFIKLLLPMIKVISQSVFKPKVCQTFGALQPLNVLQKIENNPVQGWTITQGPPLKTYVYLNKWMDGTKKTSNKHEHRWAPMNAHEHPWSPMNLNVSHWFFIDFPKHCSLQFIFSVFVFLNGWFIILGVWSCVVLSQSILFTKLENHNSVFFILAGLEPRKTLHCHCCSTCLYIYIDINI